MIKLSAGSFHNFKCGDVFCLSFEEYNIACCLCGSKVDLLEFPAHFQQQHLSSDSPLGTTKKKSKDALDTFNENKSNIKEEEADNRNVEEVSAFSWEDNFQEQDEIPIDINFDASNSNSNNIKKNIGELGSITVVYGGNEDDDIDIGVQNDEWLHEKYNYDDVPTDDDDNNDEAVQLDEEELDIKDVKLDAFYSDESEDADDSIEYKKDSSGAIEIVNCEFCDRVFNSKIGLKIHVKAVHKKEEKTKKGQQTVQSFQCDVCGDKFLTEKSLKNHHYKHTGIFCEICGKTFSQIGNLERHKLRHTGIKSKQCTECDNTFFTDKELKAHMIRHTGLMPNLCEICGKQCRDHGVLTAHMRRHTGERPAKCNVCGKSFFCGYDLNVHSVTHTTERPFKCDICGSSFQLKKSLRVHKKIHAKNREHVCKICGKAFAQSSGLHAHMRMHDTTSLPSVGVGGKFYETETIEVSTESIQEASGSQWSLL